jgi:two-component system, cell cycle sensor histidine kinase and response regulator CckA
MIQVITPINRLVQFAAILLELGGAVLVALLFGLIRRYAPRRKYFATWAWAWLAMVIGIGAVAYRYVLLGDIAGGPVPDSSGQVRALYALYQGGKVLFWLLVCRGVIEYARPGDTWSRGWPFVAIAYSVVSAAFSTDLNAVLVWQAPVAVMACALGAGVLFRLRPSQRSVGSVVTGTVLTISAALWAVYFVVFGGAIALLPPIVPWFSDAVSSYNSYADMLMIVMLGYAMVVLFMEDARLRISESEARLAALVSSAADAIITADGDLRLLDANLAAERLFGFRRETAVGRPIGEFIAAADRSRFQGSLNSFLDGTAALAVLQADEELRAIRHDGALFTFEASASKVRANATTSLALVVRDVTERREREEKKRQLQKMETVRQLAGGLAHDFNNLLTAIVGRNQIVARSLPAGSPLRDDVAEIERAAGTAARLTVGLLALSRREMLYAERVALNGVLRSLEARIQAEAPHVEFRYAIDAGDVHADPARLQEVILAVTQNAVEATGSGAGRITIETSRLTRQKEIGRLIDTACIVVSDTGPGLSRAARAHLFEPFFSTRGDGRGLGLATAYAFLQQSGGWMDVQSSSNGTTVRLALPIVQGEAIVFDNAESHAGITAVAQPPARRTVLVAEDEDSVRRLVRAVLEREGWCVLECENGMEALAAFESGDPPVDVLLTDVVMPQMGGRELASRLLALKPSLRVIFMSGFVDDGELLEGFSDRATPFLQKPFDIAELASTVRRAMEQ